MSEDLALAPSPSSIPNSNATPTHTPSPASEAAASSTLSRPSSSRVLNPAPAPARVTPKIATSSSPPLDYPAPSPLGGGPTSGSYVVPPRPKPGRKPATDEPASKRKAQNRESQRAFRARKAAKLTEMQSQVETAQQQHRQELMTKEAELNDSLNRIRQLEAELSKAQDHAKRATKECDFWKDKANASEEMVRQLKDRDDSAVGSWPGKSVAIFPNPMNSSRRGSPARESLGAFTPLATTPQAYSTPQTLDIGCGNCKATGECACLEEMAKLESPNAFMPAIPLSHGPSRTISEPMKGVIDSDSFAEREIDFTATFSSNKKFRVDTRPSIAFLTQTHEPCGFCTDESNCLCKDQSLQMNSSTSNPVRSPNATSGPGSCDACMKNPKQRAWCQRISQLKSEGDYFSSRPNSRASSISSGIGPMEPRIDPGPADGRGSIGCSEAFKLLDGRVPTDREDMDWSSLHPQSPSMRKDTLPAIDPRRKYSALELDTAGVIATLQQTIGPLSARKEDGAHASLVRIAQERQRSSNSPRVGGDGWR